jgi:hypothetical protein
VLLLGAMPYKSPINLTTLQEQVQVDALTRRRQHTAMFALGVVNAKRQRMCLSGC